MELEIITDPDYDEAEDLTCTHGTTWIVRGDNKHGDRMDPYWKAVATYLVNHKVRILGVKQELDYNMEPFNPTHQSLSRGEKPTLAARRSIKAQTLPRPERRPLAVPPIPGESRKKSDVYSDNGTARWLELREQFENSVVVVADDGLNRSQRRAKKFTQPRKD